MTRSKGLNLIFVIFAFFAVAAETTVMIAAPQGAGKWSYFKFEPGQFFKYQMKSSRGLTGWASIKVEDGGSGTLNVTLAGTWTKDFSEMMKLTPKMSGFDFVYSAKDSNITNALSSLVNIDAAVVDATWKEGFKWSQGDKSIEVAGPKEYAGVKGLVVTFGSKVFGRAQKRIYCVSPDLPLPVFAEVPAANDTWTYELVEKKGI